MMIRCVFWQGWIILLFTLIVHTLFNNKPWQLIFNYNSSAVAATKYFVMIIQQPFTQMVTIFSTVKKFVTEPINEHYETHLITVQVQEFERNRIVQWSTTSCSCPIGSSTAGSNSKRDGLWEIKDVVGVIGHFDSG